MALKKLVRLTDQKLFPKSTPSDSFLDEIVTWKTLPPDTIIFHGLDDQSNDFVALRLCVHYKRCSSHLIWMKLDLRKVMYIYVYI